MLPRDLRDRTTLITGGGTGIGRGIALALARRGAPVVLCGRRRAPLEAVAAEVLALGGRATVVPGDIADPAARAAVMAAARAACGPFHILVNNAGVLASGALLQLNGEEIEHAVATNLAAPIDLTRLALADLALVQGAVVFVGSTMSHVPMPYASLYSATKGGLHAFCTALRYELAPLGVHLLEAYPPTVETAMTAGMARRAGGGQPRPTAPEEAGERIVAALAAGQHEVTWGGGEQWLLRAQRVAPGLVTAALRSQRRRFAHVMTPEPVHNRAEAAPARASEHTPVSERKHAPKAAPKAVPEALPEAATPRGTSPALAAQLAAVRAAYHLRTVTVDGHAWTYLDTNPCSNGLLTGASNDALLLLPGAMGAADTSFEYIFALRHKHRIVSLDYPAALDDLPALLAAFPRVLAALGIDGAHVIGGSFSGLVAQHLGSRHPACVRSLLLSNIGAPDPREARRWQAAAALLHPLPEALVQRLMHAGIGRFLPGDSPAEQFWRGYFAAAIPGLSKRVMLSRLRLAGATHGAGDQLRRAPYGGPVLIINAEHDALVSRRQRDALRILYPQARCVAMPDRGHGASLNAAATYIALYREFLCRLTP